MKTFTKMFAQVLGVMTVVGLVLVGCVQASPTGEDSDGGGSDSGTPPGDTTPPAEVASVGAAVADGSVTLSWTDPADPDFDGVEITWTPGGSSPVTVAPGVETYQATSLANDTVHTFTITTLDADGNKSSGVTIAATPTAPDLDAPGDVTGLAAETGEQYVKLTWNDPPDADLDQILVSVAPGGSTPLTVDAGVETLTIINLTNDQSYTFTVKAEDTEGNTSPGVSVGATPRAPDTTPPDAPTILGVSDGALTNGSLSFTVGNLEPGASVEYSKDNGESWSGYTGEVTITSEGVYTITARQTDAAGNTSANAVPVSAEIDKTAPGPVGGRSVATGERSATVTWNDPSAPDLESILLTWTPGGGSTTVPAGTESYTATGLTPGERYQFSLRARDAAGNEGPSRTVAGTVPLSGELGNFTQLALEHTDYDAKRGWTTNLYLFGEKPPVDSAIGDYYDPGLGEVSDILLAQLTFDIASETPSLPSDEFKIEPGERTEDTVYEAQFAVNLTYDFKARSPISADHAGATPNTPMTGEGADNEYEIKGGVLRIAQTKTGYEVSFEFDLDHGYTVFGKYTGAIDLIDYPQPPEADAYWPFDGSADDAYGELNLAGEASYTDGRDGQSQSAVSFDGKDERLFLSMGKYPNHPINNLGEDGISFSFWMHDSGGNTGSSIFSRWPVPSMEGPYSYDLQFTSSEGFEVWAGQQRVSGTVDANAFDREWNHVVVTWGFTSDELEIYVNGVSEYLGDASPFENYEQMRLIPSIGFADNEERVRDEFHGAIDDFRIYASVIGAADVLKLYRE